MKLEDKVKNDARKAARDPKGKNAHPPNPKGNNAARRADARAAIQRVPFEPAGNLRRGLRLRSGLIFGTKKIRKLALKIERKEMRDAVAVLAKVPEKQEEKSETVTADGWKDSRSGR